MYVIKIGTDSFWKYFSVTRNVYSEKSKADDVQFILDLIAKIGAEIPEADMNNVNIAGNIPM